MTVGQRDPAGLLEGRPATAMDSETWNGRDLRAGGVLIRLDPSLRVGDLVRLQWSWSSWFPREPDEAPRGYAGWETLWLALTESGWVVVEAGMGIT